MSNNPPMRGKPLQHQSQTLLVQLTVGINRPAVWLPIENAVVGRADKWGSGAPPAMPWRLE